MGVVDREQLVLPRPRQQRRAVEAAQRLGRREEVAPVRTAQESSGVVADAVGSSFSTPC